MKKLLTLILIFCAFKVSAQTYTLNYDSVRVGKTPNSSVLIPKDIYLKGIPKGLVSIRADGKLIHNDTVYAPLSGGNVFDNLNGYTAITSTTNPAGGELRILGYNSNPNTSIVILATSDNDTDNSSVYFDFNATTEGVNKNIRLWYLPSDYAGGMDGTKRLMVGGTGLTYGQTVNGLQPLLYNYDLLTLKDSIAANYLSLTGGIVTGDVQYNVAPVNSTSLINKSYVDNLITGLTWKKEVKASTTANITLSGTQTIDGVSLIAGDRVLVKNQTTASENGIWVVASGSWTRADDADSTTEIQGATVMVRLGTANKDTQWTNSNSNDPIVGTDAITFAQISGAGTYANGTGINLTGNVFSFDTTFGDARYKFTTIAGYGITDAITSNTAQTGLTGNKTSNATWTFGNVNITSLTQGSVLFSGASGAISQDNSSFFWDNTTKRLGLLTTAPTTTITLSSTTTGLTHFNTSDQTTNFEKVRKFFSGSGNTGIYNIIGESGGTGVTPAIMIGDAFARGLTIGLPFGAPYSKLSAGNISAAAANVIAINGTSTSTSSGNPSGVSIYFDINQASGPAGSKSLFISSYQPNKGLGVHYLADWGTNSGASGSGTHTRLFSVLNTGQIFSSSLTASTALVSDASKNIVSSSVTATELGYVSGVTSAIQTQLGGKQSTITFGTGVQTALGVNVGSAGAPVLFNGAGGTPSSLVGTNITGTATALNIGGNAATVTNGAYINSTNSFTAQQNFTVAPIALFGTGGSGGSAPSVYITSAGIKVGAGPNLTNNYTGLLNGSLSIDDGSLYILTIPKRTSTIATTTGTLTSGTLGKLDVNGNFTSGPADNSGNWNTAYTSRAINGSYSVSVTAQTSFTVTIGSTMANTNYGVSVAPANALSRQPFSIENKTTTTFDVVYTALPLSPGTLSLGWTVFP